MRAKAHEVNLHVAAVALISKPAMAERGYIAIAVALSFGLGEAHICKLGVDFDLTGTTCK